MVAPTPRPATQKPTSRAIALGELGCELSKVRNPEEMIRHIEKLRRSLPDVDLEIVLRRAASPSDNSTIRRKFTVKEPRTNPIPKTLITLAYHSFMLQTTPTNTDAAYLIGWNQVLLAQLQGLSELAIVHNGTTLPPKIELPADTHIALVRGALNATEKDTLSEALLGVEYYTLLHTHQTPTPESLEKLQDWSSQAELRMRSTKVESTSQATIAFSDLLGQFLGNFGRSEDAPAPTPVAKPRPTDAPPSMIEILAEEVEALRMTHAGELVSATVSNA